MSTMDELRKELFSSIKALRAGEMDCAQAKAMSELAQTIINTAKAETEFARATGRKVVSGLINAPDDAPEAPSSGTPQMIKTGTGTKTVIGNRTVHKMG